MTPKDKKRFWSKVKVDRATGCWIFGKPSLSTYGAFCLNGRQEGAHRVAWMIKRRRKIPKGKFVLHNCDVKRCVRHIRLGTHKNNMEDMSKRGRSAPSRYPHLYQGSRQAGAKINEAVAKKIYSLLRSGNSVSAVSRKLGVGIQIVSRIRRGSGWRHVTSGIPVVTTREKPPPESIPKGSVRAHSKLRESDIPKIRRLISSGLSLKKIGQRFSVGPVVIFRIKHKLGWIHA